MSFRMAYIGVVLAFLQVTADARPLPRVLERARYMEEEHQGGCIGPSFTSPVYAAFQWVVKHFTQDELLALLHHPSGVVRAYAVQHVARQLPANSEALFPLLADAKVVPVLPAEESRGFAIDAFVAEQLCKHASVPAIRQGLRRAASRPTVRTSVRYQIRSCSRDAPTDDPLLDIPLSAAPSAPPR